MNIPKKHNKISGLSVTSDKSKCAYWLNIHSVKVGADICYQTQMSLIFVTFFSRNRAIFSTCPNKESSNKKYCYVRIM